MKYLTTSSKGKLKPYLLAKQDNKCIFCKDTFLPNPPNAEASITYEHLDGNVFHNKPENLALAHKRCNKAKSANSDYQIIAKQLLSDNHNSFDLLGESVKSPAKGREPSIEIDVNKAYLQLTKEYLNARLITANAEALNKKDACRSIAYLIYEKLNQGSPYTAQKAIEMFTSTAAPFEEIDENGETLIIKRTGKQKQTKIINPNIVT